MIKQPYKPNRNTNNINKNHIIISLYENKFFHYAKSIHTEDGNCRLFYISKSPNTTFWGGVEYAKDIQRKTKISILHKDMTAEEIIELIKRDHQLYSDSDIPTEDDYIDEEEYQQEEEDY